MRKFWYLVLMLAMVAVPAMSGAAHAKDMKVGFVYVSPIGDAGYSYAHDLGRQAIAEMPGVSTSFVESVAEGADAERVILNMARKGYDIIFATSFGYMDPSLKVSKKFPNVNFMHCSGYKTSTNMSAYFGRMYQARFLAGMVAGSMTKSNKLGYVGAFPIPEVIRGINAFALGAQSVNPNVEVRVVWSKTWYDPATEKEAAKSLLDVGCDVIAQHQDSPAPQEAAQERGVYSVGYNSDMSQFAPNSHLTAAVWNWAPFYTDVVNKVKSGEWKHGNYWVGMDKGIVGLAPYGKMVPENVRNTVDARKAEIISGAYQVFSGPVFDQEGKERVAAGKHATDEELLGMTWFVKGVIGTTE
ncbi:basic membrane protein A [Desulfobaculum xiamenense]|uniref:Basic membrane protein A n=1 Tax=Desulfobaculum xiamenense TaxID=995050 RepID=A0A846QL56_9BACT|nr:BMP family ABC transporter substrate-binding protein [Desulfobaculum xiamenense]NJB68851.1 basic membrane protein A [Desulfobaculum xiamenense]